MPTHDNQTGAGAVIIDLSGLEKSCLTLVAKGRRRPDIGVAMNMTESEVEDVLLQAERKLKANNRLHAISLALTMGIIGGAIDR